MLMLTIATTVSSIGKKYRIKESGALGRDSSEEENKNWKEFARQPVFASSPQMETHEQVCNGE